MKSTLVLTLSLCLAATLSIDSSVARAQDADGDGLPDAVEQQLGTDPHFAEHLVTLGTFPARNKEHPELDIVRVDFGNVAKDRWLWAVHFAKPHTFENSQLILYLDADNDPKTGRTDMGCEAMLSHHEGRPGATGFAPDGGSRTVRAPRVALAGGVLYLCHDGPIHQQGGRSAFRFSILEETQRPYRSASSAGWVAASGPPNSDRKKRLMLDDITEDEDFQTTERLDLIWKLQADPANVVLSSVQAELKGMAYYDTEYRWPAVVGANGTITVTVPRAGKFYPAVVVYDTGGPEAYELQLDGKPLGRFVAAEDDNRQRVHFLNSAIEFRGGEKLTFRTGSAGRHITEDILLLAQKPPVRDRLYEIRQVEAGYVERAGGRGLRLTWITTWPVACTIEYGTSPQYGNQIAEESPLANHRVFVGRLQPGQKIHYRIVCTKPDGTRLASPDHTAAMEPLVASKGTAERERVELRVENPYEFPLPEFPVTSGVPFAKGELTDAEHLWLLDAQGREVIMQPKVAARWQDGSVKWVHISFLADSGAKSTAKYTLEYGSEVSRPVLGTFSNDSGFSSPGPQLIPELDDAKGVRYRAVTDWGGEEEAGPVCKVFKTLGHFQSPTGQCLFRYINRYTFYAHMRLTRVEFTWTNNNKDAPFTEFSSIGLRLAPAPQTSWSKWIVGLGGDNEASGQGEMELRQLRDNAFQIMPRVRPGVKTRRADGWIDVSNSERGPLELGVTIAVRDFWQLYPKGFRFREDGLWIDLCPPFSAGTYDECSKLDEIKLYYYLMGGKYKVAQGVQKRHEIMFYDHKGALDQRTRNLVRAFQEPLIAVCSPERYCATGVFGEILPATAGRSAEYEKVCEQVYQGYVRHREASHEYGMLNFGDQWGERRVNWANGEYDHHHAFLMQFARTGDRKWYFLGEKAARHAIDVDTCHAGPRRGGEWIHSMGHTGGYFKQPYEGNGIPSPGMSVSHTWTEGFYDWYALSGDPEGAENAALVADYYDGAYLSNYDWGNCRTNGWHLLLTIAAYRATNDPYYLNAARIIIERTLERQSPGGGWHRQMVPGHCHDMPRHRGEANFMLGVLANGLEEYYREVPDPRVAEAIQGGTSQAVKELWVADCDGFRYTSCPNMKGYTANNDMTAEILFFAHRLGGDPQFGQIAMRAMRSAFAGGIGSIAHLRWTPHIIDNMDRLERGKK